jgi:hypothetical protein
MFETAEFSHPYLRFFSASFFSVSPLSRNNVDPLTSHYSDRDLCQCSVYVCSPSRIQPMKLFFLPCVMEDMEFGRQVTPQSGSDLTILKTGRGFLLMFKFNVGQQLKP